MFYNFRNGSIRVVHWCSYPNTHPGFVSTKKQRFTKARTKSWRSPVCWGHWIQQRSTWGLTIAGHIQDDEGLIFRDLETRSTTTLSNPSPHSPIIFYPQKPHALLTPNSKTWLETFVTLSHGGASKIWPVTSQPPPQQILVARRIWESAPRGLSPVPAYGQYRYPVKTQWLIILSICRSFT